MADLRGILCIGDPHLWGRTPGTRRDDYPRAALEKLFFCLEAARREALLPVVLGDLFHKPRDVATPLLVELIERLPDPPVLAIAGNHDTAESRLEPADALSVLVAAGRVRLVSREPWRGAIGGRAVAIGGTDWAGPIPEAVDRAALGLGEDGLLLWLTHHDVRFRGYEDAGRLEPREIAGVDLVVNGHIHRPLEGARAGRTTWLNYGSLTRVKRGESSRRAPAALAIDVVSEPPGWRARRLEVPHRPFDEVFFPEEPAASGAPGEPGSAFVANMAALLARRTADGQSLVDFLDRSLGRYEDGVAREVRRLAREVLGG
jgi:predicted phosphodiesterase